MKPRCPNHDDNTRCAVKDSQDASEIVREASNDGNAAKIATEAMRCVLERYGGIRRID